MSNDKETYEQKQARLKREVKPKFQVGTEVQIYTTGVIDKVEWDCFHSRWMYHIDFHYGSANVDGHIIEDVNCVKKEV